MPPFFIANIIEHQSSMDYATLKAELLAGHPVTGAYDADNQVAADQLNAVNRTRNRTSMTGDEIFNAAVPADYAALDNGSGNTPDQQGLFMAFCGRTEIDPFAANNVQFITNMFGAGSGTVTALQAARVENVSRAVELNLGAVNAGDVSVARAL